ncbi:hypothetical protein [Fundicoccus culcitae]|uniref:Uncharacterized protein n=1 Tax=Fundicoccus culcitae TaxID=2969821 RepID=A0ABY5P8T6_9LACT|nr:hypothetical protein [Fundicoccus culcitae]UUX35157.1 hypothetical protein NRE15_05815 [Fundicoccus culcitae]
METAKTFKIGRTILKKIEFYEPEDFNISNYNVSTLPEFTEDRRDMRMLTSIEITNETNVILSVELYIYFYLLEDYQVISKNNEEYRNMIRLCFIELDYFIHTIFRNTSHGIEFKLDIDGMLEESGSDS